MLLTICHPSVLSSLGTGGGRGIGGGAPPSAWSVGRGRAGGGGACTTMGWHRRLGLGGLGRGTLQGLPGGGEAWGLAQ